MGQIRSIFVNFFGNLPKALRELIENNAADVLIHVWWFSTTLNFNRIGFEHESNPAKNGIGFDPRKVRRIEDIPTLTGGGHLDLLAVFLALCVSLASGAAVCLSPLSGCVVRCLPLYLLLLYLAICFRHRFRSA